MIFEETKENSIKIINELFLEKLRINFPQNLYETFKDDMLKITIIELTPIFNDIIEKNESSLKAAHEKIQELEITEDEKQVKFNEELNSVFNIYGKLKMTQKVYVITKASKNFINFSNGVFSKKFKKKEKEIKLFKEIIAKYNLKKVWK